MTTTSLIIPVHNNLALTRDFLTNVIEYTPPSELIIVDNGSTDLTEEWIGTILDLKTPRVKALRYEENRGFSAAVNAGLGMATGDVLVVLNNDCRLIDLGWISQITRALREKPKSLVGAELITYNRLVEKSDGERIPYLAGWCLAFNRLFLRDVGVYDAANFVSYYEDVDLCFRAVQAGYSLLEIRSLGLYHLGGRTGRLIPGIHAVGMESRRNFAKKWGITWAKIPGFDMPLPSNQPVDEREWLAVPLEN